MKQTLHFLRPAVAMIELIFAIVVMGIVMMSVPQLLNIASSSGYIAIQQEGINEASTQMSIMMDYPWDENDTNGSHVTVLNVTNGDPALNGGIGIKKRRAGTPIFSHRLYKSFNGSEFNASVIGLDGAAETIDDIDDFNNTVVHLQLDGGLLAIKDYIEKGNDITITRAVTYMDDTAANYNTGGGGVLNYDPTFTNATPSTNIKHLQVTLTSNSGVDELEKTITLHAFSCNIGTYQLKEN